MKTLYETFSNLRVRMFLMINVSFLLNMLTSTSGLVVVGSGVNFRLPSREVIDELIDFSDSVWRRAIKSGRRLLPWSLASSQAVFFLTESSLHLAVEYVLSSRFMKAHCSASVRVDSDPETVSLPRLAGTLFFVLKNIGNFSLLSTTSCQNSLKGGISRPLAFSSETTPSDKVVMTAMS